MPATKAEKLAYRRKFMKTLRKSNRMQKEVARDIRRMAKAMRDDIHKELTELAALHKGKRITPQQVEYLREKASGRIEQFRAEATALMDNFIAQAGKTATATVAELAPLLNVTGSAIIGLDPEIVALSAQFSADLIQNLSVETLNKVNGTLSLSFMGELDLYDTMREIDGALGTTLKKGVTPRAETIARTEFNRAYNGAEQMSLKTLADGLDPTEREYLDKEWISALIPGRTRDAHEAAHGQIVPYDSAFIVNGEELMFPGDPAGSAHNTINCLCTMVINTDRLLDHRAEAEQGIAPR